MSALRVVWKYQVGGEFNAPGELELPARAEIVHASLDPSGLPCVWALVDPGVSVPTERRWFQLVATGQDIPAGAVHAGTFITGPYIWHVFEMTRAAAGVAA